MINCPQTVEFLDKRSRALTKLIRATSSIPIGGITMVRSGNRWSIQNSKGEIFNKDLGNIGDQQAFVKDIGSGEHWLYVTRFDLSEALTHVGGEWAELSRYVPSD